MFPVKPGLIFGEPLFDLAAKFRVTPRHDGSPYLEAAHSGTDQFPDRLECVRIGDGQLEITVRARGVEMKLNASVVRIANNGNNAVKENHSEVIG